MGYDKWVLPACFLFVKDSNTHNYTVVRGSIHDSATDRNL